MSKEKVTSFFSHDHDQLDGYLKAFQRLKTVDFEQAKVFFKKFQCGLQRHILWEDEILFPVFEDKTGMKDHGPTFVLREEHRQIEAILEEIRQKVCVEDLHSDAEEKNLMTLLTDHDLKEESVLYPALDQLASDQERFEIFQKMGQIPKDRYEHCGHSH